MIRYEEYLSVKGKRGMGNGEWGMGNGEWGMGNGEWEIKNLEPFTLEAPGNVKA